MDSYVNAFFKTEITVIPRLLDKYFGKYYSNVLCNGITWMFALWCIIHAIFHKFLNALLKKLQYKAYERIRLEQSLWYLGFYTSACLYSTATLLRNNVQIIKTGALFDAADLPSGHLILGFVMLVAFFLHSACWEKLNHNHAAVASVYLCLSFVVTSSYFLRYAEGAFRLTIVICSTQIALELARCGAVLVKRLTVTGRIVVWGLFGLSSVTVFINDCLIIPIFFLYPLFNKITLASGVLLLLLVAFLVLEAYDCVLVKLIYHSLYHGSDSCDLTLAECSLFPPRNDAAYNFQVFKKEMKQRQEESLSSRKPKRMVYQTLQCMMAIKRKLKERRKKDPECLKHEIDDETRENNDKINKEIVVGGILAFNINNKSRRNVGNKSQKAD